MVRPGGIAYVTRQSIFVINALEQARRQVQEQS
jgi:hypothetical protein